MPPPLLSCISARIDLSGEPVVDGLNGESVGNSVGLIGPWGPLFRVLAAAGNVSSGCIRLGGHDAVAAVATGSVGLALYEPGLPSRWSVSQYLQASAQLTGLSKRGAETEARSVLDRCQVSWLANAKLRDLPPVHQRLVVVLHATLGSPAILALETPLLGLDEASQRQLAEAVGRAASERGLLLSVGQAAPGSVERSVLDTLDEVWVLRQGSVVARGPAAQVLASANRYLVVVTRQAHRLASALTDRETHVTLNSPELPEAAGPDSRTRGDARAGRLIVDLEPNESTDVIVEAALEVKAPIVELRPLSVQSD